MYNNFLLNENKTRETKAGAVVVIGTITYSTVLIKRFESVTQY